MPALRTLFHTTVLSAFTGATAFTLWTRHAKFVPLSANDAIFASPAYLANNPQRNPETKDLCIRRVPLHQIRPHLLEKASEGKLVEAFCAGVWGGFGYAYQRRYLEKKYRNDQTAHQLWDRSALLTSSYDPGTQITDHFEVIAKSPSAIVVRCGDSPLVRGLRDSDGLFEMGVQIKPDEGVAEFCLKSVFYKGLGSTDSPPMPPHVEFAHRLYTKLWMESALRNVVV